MTEFSLAERQKQIDKTAHSDWLIVDQSMIDRFADATLDHQFIHVDPVRAAETPFGGTIAHGFLTLSLISHFAMSVPGFVPPGLKMSINYGFERVRFVHPVSVGSSIRAAMTLQEIAEKKPNQFQQKWNVVVEIEDKEKPALTADWLVQFFV